MSSVEFEHFIGLNTFPNGVIFHPNNQSYLFSSGGNVVIGDITDPHNQSFFREHTSTVSAMALSRSGRLVASGQQGENSDIFVWDFASKRVLFCFEEHDHRIQSLAFSADERLLLSVGSAEDGKLIIWDMSTGCIVSSSGKLPPNTLASTANFDFLKDIKRRNTPNYLFGTGGSDGLLLWELNPYSGELIQHKLASDSRAVVGRCITSLSFSPDYEFLFAGTTSGDFLVINMKHLRIVQSIAATQTGLDSLLSSSDGLVIGCGDGSIKLFDMSLSLVGVVQLDAGRVNSLSFSSDKLEVIPIIFILAT